MDDEQTYPCRDCGETGESRDGLNECSLCGGSGGFCNVCNKGLYDCDCDFRKNPLDCDYD